MNKKNRWLFMLAMVSAALTGQAVTITGWNTIGGGAGDDYEWEIPQYNNQVIVSANITTNTTWTSDKTYVLMDPVYVTGGATLTIQPGTVIRGMPWVSASDVPGALTVTKGSKIHAKGTAASPIIFTDMWDNNVPGMTAGTVAQAPADHVLMRDYSVWQPEFGYWGSVVIVGNTPIAGNASQETGIGLTAKYVEGLPETALTQYGNGIDGVLNDDDNSGVFTYVQLRYGGYPLSGTKEINGLSLYGVGRGTEIHHIEVLNNLDDGFEWFGGNVNTKYLVSWAIGDDHFDSDEGYRGMCQFALGVQGNIAAAPTTFGDVVGSGSADKGMEIDGATGKDSAQPYALSQWYNLTLIGKGTSVTNYQQVKANTAILCRDNSGPQIYNSVFMDFGGSAAAIEYREDVASCANRMTTAWNNFPVNSASNAFPNSLLYQAQTEGYQLELADSVFYNFGGILFPTNKADVIAAGGTEDAGTPANHISWNGTGSVLPRSFGEAYYNNKVAASSPIQQITRNAADPVKGAANVSFLNPCAAGDAVSGTRYAPNNGFYTPVSYKGAFSEHYNWLEGWTAVDRLGLVDTSMNASVPAEDIRLTASVIFQSKLGVDYRIEASDDMSSWYTVGVVKGDGSVLSVTDMGEFDSRMFYRVSMQ